MSTKYTSAGVIRNSDKPRVGVVSQHSLSSWFFESQGDWVDLGYEAVLEDVTAEVRGEMPGADEQEIDDEIETRMQDVETNGPWLIGDWVKGADGLYSPIENGTDGFAAQYNADSGNVCVNWSRTTKRTHHTSPCYVMADGSGPCGDLDTDGDSVLAYTLPADCFVKDDTDCAKGASDEF